MNQMHIEMLVDIAKRHGIVHWFDSRALAVIAKALAEEADIRSIDAMSLVCCMYQLRYPELMRRLCAVKWGFFTMLSLYAVGLGTVVGLSIFLIVRSHI